MTKVKIDIYIIIMIFDEADQMNWSFRSILEEMRSDLRNCFGFPILLMLPIDAGSRDWDAVQMSALTFEHRTLLDRCVRWTRIPTLSFGGNESDRTFEMSQILWNFGFPILLLAPGIGHGERNELPEEYSSLGALSLRLVNLLKAKQRQLSIRGAVDRSCRIGSVESVEEATEKR